MSFDTLGLSAELLRADGAQGYSEPTPIQRKVIPVILAGRDVLAGARTGTGKTAGFALPLLQRPSANPIKNDRRPIRALILTPTRELAIQVSASVKTYGYHLPLQSTVVFGRVKINPQIKRLRRGVDILVATPGRLLDHGGRKTVNLSQIEQVVPPVDKCRKRELLSHMIGSRNWRQVLVFTRTKHGANRLAQQLEQDGLSAAAIHGNKSQGARTRALSGFKSGESRYW